MVVLSTGKRIEKKLKQEHENGNYTYVDHVHHMIAHHPNHVSRFL